MAPGELRKPGRVAVGGKSGLVLVVFLALFGVPWSAFGQTIGRDINDPLLGRPTGREGFPLLRVEGIFAADVVVYVFPGTPLVLEVTAEGLRRVEVVEDIIVEPIVYLPGQTQVPGPAVPETDPEEVDVEEEPPLPAFSPPLDDDGEGEPDGTQSPDARLGTERSPEEGHKGEVASAVSAASEASGDGLHSGRDLGRAVFGLRARILASFRGQGGDGAPPLLELDIRSPAISTEESSPYQGKGPAAKRLPLHLALLFGGCSPQKCNGSLFSALQQLVVSLVGAPQQDFQVERITLWSPIRTSSGIEGEVMVVLEDGSLARALAGRLDRAGFADLFHPSPPGPKTWGFRVQSALQEGLATGDAFDLAGMVKVAIARNGGHLQVVVPLKIGQGIDERDQVLRLMVRAGEVLNRLGYDGEEPSMTIQVWLVPTEVGTPPKSIRGYSARGRDVIGLSKEDLSRASFWNGVTIVSGTAR